MKPLPTLPPTVDEDECSPSSSGTSNSNLRPTLPVDTDLEIAELSHVELQRPGAKVDIPLPSEVDEGIPFILKDGLPHRVEPLPVPLDSL